MKAGKAGKIEEALPFMFYDVFSMTIFRESVNENGSKCVNNSSSAPTPSPAMPPHHHYRTLSNVHTVLEMSQELVSAHRTQKTFPE